MSKLNFDDYFVVDLITDLGGKRIEIKMKNLRVRILTDAELLDLSAQKYEALLRAADEHGDFVLFGYYPNFASCPLCYYYAPQYGQWKVKEEGLRCIHCPIYKHTGFEGCIYTPWESIVRTCGSINKMPEYIQAIRDELAFLRELQAEYEDGKIEEMKEENSQHPQNDEWDSPNYSSFFDDGLSAMR